MPLVFYLIILFLVLEIFSFFYIKLFSQLNFLRYSIILGIFLHEFSHYIGCKLTLTPVKKFHISQYEGYVIHGKSKIPILGSIIITLSPLLFGLCALAGIIYYITNDKNIIMALLENGKEYQWLELFKYFKKWVLDLNYGSWQFWLGLFLSLNIIATFTPSKKDYKNILWAGIAYVALSYFFKFFDKINMFLVYVLIIANILLVFAIFCLVLLNLLKKVLKFL